MWHVVGVARRRHSASVSFDRGDGRLVPEPVVHWGPRSVCRVPHDADAQRFNEPQEGSNWT